MRARNSQKRTILTKRANSSSVKIYMLLALLKRKKSSLSASQLQQLRQHPPPVAQRPRLKRASSLKELHHLRRVKKNVNKTLKRQRASKSNRRMNNKIKAATMSVWIWTRY